MLPKLASTSAFQLNILYTNDVLSINNTDFENYMGQMYPAEIEIKNTTKSYTSTSYLDLLLSIGRDGQLNASLYNKYDDFNFHITNFPFRSSAQYSIFASLWRFYLTAHTVYQACSSYQCFILREARLSSKLL